jgi:HK97 family phage major capsid protein
MELKEYIEAMKKVWEDLKSAQDKMAAEVKTRGEAHTETKGLVDKLNERLSELEVKVSRPAVTKVEPKEGELTPAAKAFCKAIREGKVALSKEEKQLVEDATGQLIVPWDMDSEIYRAIGKLTVVRGISAIRNTTRDRVRMISMNEVSVGWGKVETEEGDAYGDVESTLVPAEMFQYVEDQIGLTKIGEDELADTDVNLYGYLADSFGQALAESEDTAFIEGTGHASVQPMGLFTAEFGGGPVRVETEAEGAVSTDDILELIYAVPSQYRKGSSFIMAGSTVKAIRKLRNSVDGSYAWQPSMQAGEPGALFGYPVYEQDDIAAIAEVAEPVIFGNFKLGYRILDRRGMTVQRLAELYAEANLIGFKVTRRVGGAILRKDAFRILTVQAGK